MAISKPATHTFVKTLIRTRLTKYFVATRWMSRQMFLLVPPTGVYALPQFSPALKSWSVAAGRRSASVWCNCGWAAHLWASQACRSGGDRIAGEKTEDLIPYRGQIWIILYRSNIEWWLLFTSVEQLGDKKFIINEPNIYRPVYIFCRIHSPTSLLTVDRPFRVVLTVLKVWLQLVQPQCGCTAKTSIITADLKLGQHVAHDAGHRSEMS